MHPPYLQRRRVDSGWGLNAAISVGDGFTVWRVMYLPQERTYIILFQAHWGVWYWCRVLYEMEQLPNGAWEVDDYIE